MSLLNNDGLFEKMKSKNPMELFDKEDKKEIRGAMWSMFKMMWPLYLIGFILSASAFVGGIWFILFALRSFGVI